MKVLVERVESYKDARKFVEKAFEIFNPKFRYIKPNFLKHDNPENGCITHPELVKAVWKLRRSTELNQPSLKEDFTKSLLQSASSILG